MWLIVQFKLQTLSEWLRISAFWYKTDDISSLRIRRGALWRPLLKLNALSLKISRRGRADLTPEILSHTQILKWTRIISIQVHKSFLKVIQVVSGAKYFTGKPVPSRWPQLSPISTNLVSAEKNLTVITKNLEFASKIWSMAQKSSNTSKNPQKTCSVIDGVFGPKK